MKHDFAIGHDKIVGYLLDSSHPRGRSKAAFLAAFGYDVTRAEELADALLAHEHLEPVSVIENAWGTRYVMEGAIRAPDGRSPRVRTIWQTSSHDDTYARLVTVYPI